MLGYLTRRALYGILILIGVNVFTFLLFFTVNTPDDMARMNIGGKRVSADAITKWKAERGYDKPVFWNTKADGANKFTRTIFWEKSVRLFIFDFGLSDSGKDLNHEIKQRMGPSVMLALPTFVAMLCVGVVFSLALTFFRHSYLDFWGVVLCVFLLSISSLFYIIVGQFFFSKLNKLVPMSGYGGGLDVVKFLIMPIILAVVARLGAEARLYRAMFFEEINRDYVRTARAKGLSEQLVLFKHVLRNAMIPIITSAGAYLPYIFMGSIVFESFFGIPGLGTFVIEAIGGQDFASVRAMVFIGAVLYVLSFMLVDVLYTLVDPRVRLN